MSLETMYCRTNNLFSGSWNFFNHIFQKTWLALVKYTQTTLIFTKTYSS